MGNQLHTDAERLVVAEAMAKDYLEIHRECTFKDLTDVQREKMESVAALARQIKGDEYGQEKGIFD